MALHRQRLESVLRNCSGLLAANNFTYCLNDGDCYINETLNTLDRLNQFSVHCKCRTRVIVSGFLIERFDGKRCELSAYSVSYLGFMVFMSFLALLLATLLVLFLVLVKQLKCNNRQHPLGIELRKLTGGGSGTQNASNEFAFVKIRNSAYFSDSIVGSQSNND